MRVWIKANCLIACLACGTLISCWKKPEPSYIHDDIYGVTVFVDNVKGTRAAPWNEEMLRDSAPIKYEDVNIDEVKRLWYFVKKIPCRGKIDVTKSELDKSVSLIVDFKLHGHLDLTWQLTPYGLTLPSGDTCVLEMEDRIKIYRGMTFRLDD